MSTVTLRAGNATGSVSWSDGTPFDGYALVGFKHLVDGLTTVNWPSISQGHQFVKRTVPEWAKLPIVNGQYDNQIGLYFNADLQPPNSQYVAFLYDVNGVRVLASATSPFTVSAGAFTIPFATPAIPTQGTNPTPD